VTVTATHRKPEQFCAILGASGAPKAGVSKHWPFDTHVDPTFLTGLSSMQEIDRKERQKTLFPGNFREVSIKHHIDLIR
jgi:hypothetical protein